MKRTILLVVSLFFISSWAVMAENNRGGGEEKSFGVTSAPRPAAKTRQPVVINMNHGTSGGITTIIPPNKLHAPRLNSNSPNNNQNNITNSNRFKTSDFRPRPTRSLLTGSSIGTPRFKANPSPRFKTGLPPPTRFPIPGPASAVTRTPTFTRR